MIQYGVMRDEDTLVLEKSLDLAISVFKDNINIVEIGIEHGDTARGIEQYLRSKVKFSYWGIDKREKLPPFEGAQVIKGDSVYVSHLSPPIIHWLFVDGCHCANHVMLDFLNYGDRMPVGGVVLFHDSHPDLQGFSMPSEFWQRHEKNGEAFGIGVREALRKLGLFNKHLQNWSVVEDCQEGWGTIILQKCV